jgi:hypothetical protein
VTKSQSIIESERVLVESIAQLQIASAVIGKVFRNMQQALGGFPSSTPGASPGSGAPEVDDGGVVPYTSVERGALTIDPARVDLDRVHRLIAQLHVVAPELYSLSREWGFDPLQAELDLTGDTGDWCTSCLRIEKCNPRDPSRYAHYCRWCGDFFAAQGRHPSLDLLLAHHESRRITQRMIDADQRPTGRRGRAA